MRRLLMKQFMRMAHSKTIPITFTPMAIGGKIVKNNINYLIKGKDRPLDVGEVNIDADKYYQALLYPTYENPAVAMAQRQMMQNITYGIQNDEAWDKLGKIIDRAIAYDKGEITAVLNKLSKNPNMRADVNKMLANIESSRKIREAFSKAKPEQWKIMERLIETKDLDPIRTGNIVTKLPTNMMVSTLTDRDFAKLLNADYKKRLDFKYARVINKGNVEKAMISLREHILGEQYHLSEYQRAQLEILMDDMTVDDFDNFYKTRFGHIVNEVFYSSDSRMMMQTTPYELFDDDVEPPKPGRTMGITEKDKIFNKFVSSLQVYMGVDDDTLDALVWEKLDRKG